MASTPVVVIAPPGLTLTLELYPVASDAIANGAGGDTLTEATNRKGRYGATVTEALSGDFIAVIKSGATAIATGFILDLQDTTATQYVQDMPPGVLDQLESDIDTVSTLLDTVRDLVEGIDQQTSLIGTGAAIAPVRISGTDLIFFQEETHQFAISTANYTSKTLSLKFEAPSGVDVATIADGSITKSANSISFAVPAILTRSTGRGRWSLRDTTDQEVLLFGDYFVNRAAA